MMQIFPRILLAIRQAFPKAAKTLWWLVKIILPISLLVSFMQYWGWIALMADELSPVFSLIGLPGESAIVFISSLFLSLYAPVAIASTLVLDVRELTILALMCLISHNMIVETAIQRKTGSSAWLMFSVRIAMSFFGAYILHLLLPSKMGSGIVSADVWVPSSVGEMLVHWVESAAWLTLKMTLIVTGLMILQNILKEFKILDLISRVFAPLMSVMGLSKESSFLWFVAQTLGLTYGSGVMIEAVNRKEISPYDANLLNHHIAINHSLLEDTLLFVAIGVSAPWIILPRFLLAIVSVWTVRLFQKLSF